MAWPESGSEVYDSQNAACRANSQYAAIVVGWIRVVPMNE